MKSLFSLKLRLIELWEEIKLSSFAAFWKNSIRFRVITIFVCLGLIFAVSTLLYRYFQSLPNYSPMQKMYFPNLLSWICGFLASSFFILGAKSIARDQPSQAKLYCLFGLVGFFVSMAMIYWFTSRVFGGS